MLAKKSFFILLILSLIIHITSIYATAEARGLYAGGSKPGVVYQYVGGNSWEEISPELDAAVLCLCWYDGHLYAGTTTGTLEASGSQSSIGDESLVAKKQFLLSGTLSTEVGKVWRYEEGAEWTLVGDNLDNQVCSLAVFRGKLYAGTAWEGGRLYKYDEPSWTRVVDCSSWDGFRSLYVWNGLLYIGDINYDKIGHYDANSFRQDVHLGGSCIWDFEEFDSNLYASAYNSRIHRSSDGSTWTTIRDYQNYNSWELEMFQGYLYVTTGPKLERYNGNEFSLVWTEPDGYEIISMVSTGNTLIFGTGEEAGSGYGVSGIGKVYAYDGNDVQLISGDMGDGIQSLLLGPLGLDLNKVDNVNDGDCVTPDVNITYTIDYNYPAGQYCPDIKDVNIIDELPPEVDFNSASAGGVYNPNSNTVTWNIGTWEPGESGFVTLTVKVKSGVQPSSIITNECEIRSGEYFLNKAEENTLVCCPTLTKEDNVPDGNYIVPDANITYYLCYDANGYGDTNVVIIDTLPDEVKYCSSNPWGVYDSNARTVTWEIGNLSPWDANCIILEVKVRQCFASCDMVVNHCEMTGDCIPSITACENTPIYHFVIEDFEKYANTTALKTVWQKKPLAADINAVSDIPCRRTYNGSRQAMALKYSNTLSRSEAYADSSLGFGFNWRLKDVKALSLWLHGIPDLRGSKSGTEPYMLIGGGAGINNVRKDVFYYFYREKAAQVSGLVAARVDSIENTDPCAMAGVMLRDTLNADSIYVATVVTDCNDVIFMYRSSPAGYSQSCGSVSGITLPHWVRIFRMSTQPFSLIAQHANDVDGSPDKWTQIGASITGGLGVAPTYLGLCVTSNSFGQMCTAQFSNVDVNSPQTTRILDPDAAKDIGSYVYNDPEAMYVVLQDNDSNGIVYYENKDANVTQTGEWTRWCIDLNDFNEQGVTLTDVRRMYIGVGDKTNPSSGSGTIYIDDIRLCSSICSCPSEECFPCWHEGYQQWLDVNKPDCWCYRRQCHGDADNLMEGSTKAGYYYVHFADLAILQSGWNIKEPPKGPGIKWPDPNICADFAHDQEGSTKTGYYRVHFSDLSILLANWNVKEPPKGPGVPPDCLDVP